MGSLEILSRKNSEKEIEGLEEILTLFKEAKNDPSKKDEAMKMLEKRIAEYEQKISELSSKESKGLNERSYSEFWDNTQTVYSDDKIVLRKPTECDRLQFLKLKEIYSATPNLFSDPKMRSMFWNEHTGAKEIMCTIANRQTDEYIGYCGIKDVNDDIWEIAVELFEEYHGKGIGTLSVSRLLDTVSYRCGKNDFRVRIDPFNIASQALFEKLGAKPNGISEFGVHDAELLRQCEEENLSLIDEQLEATAQKFHVEARKLLSHVLEYKLIWQ